ncbi:alpha/beta fold hydrolase [Peribacillus sp. SCS-37]|uniref:alpha/beta fold hydrolase n=1 Tax=Paraperibacillus esterisolvens TaxID=3115296 RepID=UPI003905A428
MEHEVYRLPDGRLLSYRITGKRSGRPVVYFHGFGSPSSITLAHSEELKEKNLFLLAVDRPGYGKSSVHPGYTAEDFADDVRDLLDNLHIQRIALSGWSTGGLFAEAFAAKYPDRIISLTLIASTLPIGRKDARAAMPGKWRPIRFVVTRFPSFLRRLASLFSRIINGKLNGKIKRALEKMPKDDRRPAGMTRNLLDRARVEGFQHKGLSFCHELEAVCSADYQRAKASFPVFIWQGDKDSMANVKSSGFLQSQYNEAELYIIQGRRHYMILSRWKEILEKIQQAYSAEPIPFRGDRSIY